MRPDDDERLATLLGGLANARRIQILRSLRFPRTLKEIEIKVEEREGSGSRNLARQTVREHLDKLLDLGVAVERPTDRGGRRTGEFTLNHQVVYLLAEELRLLAQQRPVVEPDAATITGREPAAAIRRSRGLVLVKGPDEGSAFSIDPSRGTSRWVVGRRREAAISLDFDPFVSSENAVISWADGRHHVEDVEGSMNGTHVNFERLRPGARRTLDHGDLVTVGRSSLLYWWATEP